MNAKYTGPVKIIDSFSDKYNFLSNFYFFPFEYDGVIYNTSENAFQAQKTLDLDLRNCFSFLMPGEAKRQGRRLDLREDWEEIKVDVMYDIVKTKFLYKEMKELLLSTGDAMIVEGNTWHDTFWGICNGKGLNYLGKILMQVRSELRKES